MAYWRPKGSDGRTVLSDKVQGRPHVAYQRMGWRLYAVEKCPVSYSSPTGWYPGRIVVQPPSIMEPCDADGNPTTEEER